MMVGEKNDKINGKIQLIENVRKIREYIDSY